MASFLKQIHSVSDAIDHDDMEQEDDDEVVMMQHPNLSKSNKGLVWKHESVPQSQGNPHSFIRRHNEKGLKKVYLSQQHV